MQNNLVLSFIQKFPNASSAALARMIYKDNPFIFTSVESVRSVIRYYRGASGEKSRVCNPVTPSHSSFPKLPPAITSIDNFHTIQLENITNLLILSDLHIPFQDNVALETIIKFSQGYNIDTILLNGDILDCWAISKYLKDPTHINFQDELDYTKQFLTYLHSKFPTSRIIYKEGNHEERLHNYLLIKAPELLNTEEASIPALLNLDEFGIEYIKNKQPIQLHDLYIFHGHEIKFSGGVIPAKALYNKVGKSSLCSHFHKSSSFIHNNPVTNTQTVTYSIGGICELHPSYLPLNNWNLGFSIINISSSNISNITNYSLSSSSSPPSS